METLVYDQTHCRKAAAVAQGGVRRPACARQAVWLYNPSPRQPAYLALGTAQVQHGHSTVAMVTVAVPCSRRTGCSVRSAATPLLKDPRAPPSYRRRRSRRRSRRRGRPGGDPDRRLPHTSPLTRGSSASATSSSGAVAVRGRSRCRVRLAVPGPPGGKWPTLIGAWVWTQHATAGLNARVRLMVA